MISISVCWPSSGHPTPEFSMSLANLCLYYMQTKVSDDESQAIILRQWKSSNISNGREQLVKQSLDSNATHVLFIDEDVEFSPSVLHGMIRRNRPIVACNYRLKWESGEFAAITPDYQGRIETDKKASGLQECGFCGFGFCLIERQVFEAIQQPWFPQQWHEESRSHTTEDVPFFVAAKAAGFVPYIDHDASKMIAHVGSYRYRWDKKA